MVSIVCDFPTFSAEIAIVVYIWVPLALHTQVMTTTQADNLYRDFIGTIHMDLVPNKLIILPLISELLCMYAVLYTATNSFIHTMQIIQTIGTRSRTDRKEDENNENMHPEGTYILHMHQISR